MHQFKLRNGNTKIVELDDAPGGLAVSVRIVEHGGAQLYFSETFVPTDDDCHCRLRLEDAGLTLRIFGISSLSGRSYKF